MRIMLCLAAVLLCATPFGTAAADLVGSSMFKALAVDANKAVQAEQVDPQSYRSYYIDLPSNVATLTASASAGGADVDLLVRQGIPHDATSMQGLIDQSAYVSVGQNSTETIVASRSSTPPLKPGRWWITIANPTQAPISVDLQVNFSVSGQAFQINPGMSGGWYEPAKTGQGFFFEIVNSTTAFAVWFTFTPDRKQAYIYGVGQVQGDRVVITNFFKTRGGRFGADFVRENVVLEDWGDLVFTFDSCNSGYASFLPSQSGWPAEQLNLTRLTQLAELPCSQGASQKQSYVGVGMSGAWYETARSGEGLLVEVLSPTLALIYAFTYTPDGEQAWFGGVGSLVDGSLVIPEVRQALGGVFGPSYNPAEVSNPVWGSMAMTWTACSNSVGLLDGRPAYGSWSYSNLVRLTQPAGTPACDLRTQPARLRGAGIAPPNTFLDGDVNNPNAPLIPNSNPSQTQPLTNPALVAGYLTTDPTGISADRFATTTDLIDAYTLPLAQGQVLRLSMPDHDSSDPDTVDFDLFLYNSSDTSAPVASSEGVGAVEQIIVPTSGNYDVVVFAYGGGGNYLLSVDSAGTASMNLKGLMTSLSDMVPDQFIVRFDDQGMLPGDTKALEGIADQKLASYGLKRLAGKAGEPVLVGLGDAPERQHSAKALGVKSESKMSALGWRDEGADRAMKREVIAYAKAMARLRGVRYVQPNYVGGLRATPNDFLYSAQWHYKSINLPQAWDLTTGHADVLVAVIDSGVSEHPDLAGRVRYDLGYDFIRDPIGSGDGNGIDQDARDPGVPRQPGQSASFHGTHVAGTVAANTNNGTDVAGVLWNGSVMPVRVLGSQGQDAATYDWAQGTRWAVGLPNDSGSVPTQSADVLNMSFGVDRVSCLPSDQEMVDLARSRGAIVVVASGNQATSLPGSPDSCQGVINVSAVDIQNRLASYSNFGPTIDVAAPGGSMAFAEWTAVLSTAFDNSTGVMRPSVKGSAGTSMAAPHVAGVAALMKSVYPNLTPQQFDSLLASGALTRSLTGAAPGTRDDSFGYGLIDAFKAVSEARRLATNAVPPAAPSLLPTALDLGHNLNSASVNLSNLGQGSLSVAQVSTNQPWLTASPSQTGAGGLGSYTVGVNRTGLVAASYQGKVRFQTNAGTVEVQVDMRVGQTAARGELGPLYYLLVDPVTFQVVSGLRVVGTDGRYAFDLQNLLPGSYLLLVGSDNDNDNFICDAGEACAAYPLLSAPSLIDLEPGTLELGEFPVLPDTRLLDLDGASVKQREKVPEIKRSIN